METQEMQMIQGMFETMMTRMDKMEDSFNGRMDKMETEISGVKTDMSSVKSDVSGIKVTLENVTNKNIQLLAEGQDNIVRRVEALDPIPEAVEELQSTVNVLSKLAHQNAVGRTSKSTPIKIHR